MNNPIKHLGIFCLVAIAISLVSACAPSEQRRATGEYIDDTAINARVKTALLRDNVVGGFDVSTTTYDRTVQLSGFVDTEEQRERAAEVASEVDGVEDVVNNIEIKPRAEDEQPPPQQQQQRQQRQQQTR